MSAMEEYACTAFENGNPVCQPLKSLEEVLAWSVGSDTPCVAKEQLWLRNKKEASCSPLTLVCHDMAGNYLQDRFTQGVEDSDSYRFFKWQYVDIFVYFSHNFVTIPPPGWINAAHKHGVLVLGTIISEWEDGADLCEKFLGDQCGVSHTDLVYKLVQIAKYYNFDGWLLNIENEIQKGQMPCLLDFVSCLNVEMHKEISHSKVLWYESVIESGEIKRQNEFNEKNVVFFENCDGIFLNYGWKDHNLKASKKLADEKKRPFDVFVGIDVFGRGCFGGGGYNTNKAVEEVRKHDLSIALFATGWVYETNAKENFTKNENKFWDLLTGSCSSHGPDFLPLATSFCQGFGKKYFLNGKIVSKEPWANLSLQQIQPTYGSLPSDERAAELHLDESFMGGCCLKICGKPNYGGPPQMQSIFRMNVSLGHPLLVSFTFKNAAHSATHEPILELTLEKNGQEMVLLLQQRQLMENNSEASGPSARKKKFEITYNIQLTEVKDILRNYNHFIPDKNEEWHSRYFLLKEEDVAGSILKEIKIGVDCKKKNFSILLGQIQVIPIAVFEKSSPQITDVQVVQFRGAEKIEEKPAKDNSVMVKWRCDNELLVDYYNVYSISKNNEEKLLGHTAVSTYILSAERIVDLGIKSFVIQPVLKTGFVMFWSHCPSSDMPLSALEVV